MKSIEEAKIKKGTKVLLRSNLNVPFVDGEIVDDFRIVEALKTILFLREVGAKTIIIGHTSKGGESLEPVFVELNKTVSCSFVKDVFSKEGKEILSSMNNGDVVLVENIRQYSEEKLNDKKFAKKLAKLADIFVNDDFSSAHREHASVVGVPKFIESYAGIRFVQEVETLSSAFDAPKPSVLILGGSKVGTKLPVVENLANEMDTVFVGGVSGNTLLKAKGIAIGESVVGEAPEKLLKDLAGNEKIQTYTDALVTDVADKEKVVDIKNVSHDDMIVDAGPETTAFLVDAVENAQFVLWNGPLGFYEDGFTSATHEVAKALARCGGKTIIGGGDTRAAILQVGLDDKITFISTAGGAMLEFLSKRTLPGIEALKNSA